VLSTIGIPAIILVVVIAGLLLFTVTRPASFTVNRSIAIKAPSDRIFALLQDMHRWAAWSPWEKKDPDMQRTYSGAAAGLGAVYEWNGNKNVGQGRMEIIEIKAPEKLVIKLDFLKPFEAHNMAEFTLLPTGDSVTVTWSMYGPNRYIAKVMGIFVSMDKMVGGDFETGLANLKAIAEQ
jgi:uncharacterized protein YndB with AHSA1/START domain